MARTGARPAEELPTRTTRLHLSLLVRAEGELVERWADLSQIPAELGPTVVSIGNFDGVHRGHRSVLTEVARLAQADSARSVVITFDPHPLAIHRPEACPEQITALPDKLALIAQCGIDAVLVIAYDEAFAALTPREFVHRYLVDALGARRVVVGHDIRFGKDNSGDLATLRELGKEFGYQVDVLSDVGSETFGRSRWSSTLVRELLAAGDVDKAAEVLGRYHRVTGTVVHGDARGRQLGFPTANLGPDATGMIPADGIYAGIMTRTGLPADDPDSRLPAAISIGTNPTFGQAVRRVEAHVPGRDDLELYGETISLDFVARLRHTLRFDTVDALVTQMHDDVNAALRILSITPVP